ncbi:MAG: 3-oxoacyl-ACP synthase III [Planctomycetota bacterium]|nr:3-oxoacyl-ACP synthase III [Planctomycetota bacterium]
MKFQRVQIDAIGYELAPVVVTSTDLEDRLAPMYEALHLVPGQIESLTGIVERRFWEEGTTLSGSAIKAAQHALNLAKVEVKDIETLIYTGVCREHFEPATAFAVAAGLGINSHSAIYDISNACLGVLNGMIDIANRIELGQIRAGLVVSSETAREINDIMIERMLAEKSMAFFAEALATLTGGSGAVAVLLTDGSFSGERRRRLIGGATMSAPEHHRLCLWGVEPTGGDNYKQFMTTDAVGVLKHGVGLGVVTWETFLAEIGWTRETVEKVICHQVGSGHRDQILEALEIPMEKDFSTYKYLGNMGTVSLPVTAALAEEREFLHAGDRVALLGIGSGLTCMMVGVEW